MDKTSSFFLNPFLILLVVFFGWLVGFVFASIEFEETMGSTCINHYVSLELINIAVFKNDCTEQKRKTE